MTRMLKIDIAFVIIAAAVVVALLTCDYDSKPPTRVSLLGEDALAAITGWTQSCTIETSNLYCACNVAAASPPGTGLVCNCGLGTPPCVICSGTSYESGVFGQGNPGYDASGFNGACNVYTAWLGECNNGSCADAIINVGPCTGNYAYASIQLPPP